MHWSVAYSWWFLMVMSVKHSIFNCVGSNMKASLVCFVKFTGLWFLILFSLLFICFLIFDYFMNFSHAGSWRRWYWLFWVNWILHLPMTLLILLWTRCQNLSTVMIFHISFNLLDIDLSKSYSSRQWLKQI